MSESRLHPLTYRRRGMNVFWRIFCIFELLFFICFCFFVFVFVRHYVFPASPQTTFEVTSDVRRGSLKKYPMRRSSSGNNFGARRRFFATNINVCIIFRVGWLVLPVRHVAMFLKVKIISLSCRRSLRYYLCKEVAVIDSLPC